MKIEGIWIKFWYDKTWQFQNERGEVITSPNIDFITNEMSLSEGLDNKLFLHPQSDKRVTCDNSRGYIVCWVHPPKALTPSLTY